MTEASHADQSSVVTAGQPEITGGTHLPLTAVASSNTNLAGPSRNRSAMNSSNTTNRLRVNNRE